MSDAKFTSWKPKGRQQSKKKKKKKLEMSFKLCMCQSFGVLKRILDTNSDKMGITSRWGEGRGGGRIFGFVNSPTSPLDVTKFHTLGLETGSKLIIT